MIGGRGLRLVVGVATAVGLVTSCSSGGSGGGGDDGGNRSRRVTLVLDWTPNTNHGGIYAAAAAGFYDDAGIDLAIVQPGETGALQAVASGHADFGISVQEALVPAQVQGVPVVSIGAIVAHNTSSLLSLANARIDGPADLPGHRYGGYGGQLERALIDRLVECAGGDPAGVEVIDVGNTDFRVGLEQGAFDVVWVFDGWDTLRFQQADVDVSTIAFREHLDCIPDWYTPLLVAADDTVHDDPELVEDFMAATERGYQVAIDDPEAAADALLDAAPELDEQLVRASAEFLAGEFAADSPQWGYQDPEVWSAFVSFLVEAGLLDEAPAAVEAMYTNEFLSDAS